MIAVHADIIIIGGGSAGCVLANRLSADGRRRVLLIEAGPDMPVGKIPETLLDSYPGAAYIDRRYNWQHLKVTTDVPGNDWTRRIDRKVYEQARVLGGGSTINGQLANRGSPGDYDEWEARGARGWGWQNVLPFFRKLERDTDFDGPLHGKEGPIPIHRIFPDLWPGHARAVAAALEASGLPYLPDQNGEYVDGYFPISISNLYERRVSAATAYLDPVTRQRPNLTIMTDTTVCKLLFENGRCVGVEADIGGGTIECFRAGEVILSCGAIHSPAMLLRSGVGPAAELDAMGIAVIADRQGVGRRLMDHPSVALASFLSPDARVNDYSRRHMFIGWRYTSGIGEAQSDMYAVAATRSAWHAVGAQIGSLLLTVNKTYSESGEVRLYSPHWRDEPDVQFKLLSDERDMERMADGVLRAAALHAAPELQAMTSDTFPAVWGDKVRQVGAISRRNRLYTDLAARLLDGPPALRRFLMKRYIADKYTLADLLESPDALRQFIRAAVVGVWHAASTCRMGAPGDPEAVTDPEGRVYGVEGLRVCDASIFPGVPRAALNLSVMMAAEKIADDMTRGTRTMPIVAARR